MIRILEKSVAAKIAAGEVIENPGSIVKELVENSIDSGATSIVVEIKKGGKAYIRVTDNGIGIEKDEILLAFLRHATSKISDIKDLTSIDTLGFRGEALASICAVTRLEIFSKTAAAKTGTRVVIDGGEVIDKVSTGCPEGTTIIVRDLFFNTPARLKFLKTDSSETAKISDFISKIAIGFPNISFRFMNNGQLIFSTDGRGNRNTAIANVYGHGDFDNLIEVAGENDEAKVLAFISKPTVSRPSRRNQIYFVNGRSIESKVIDKAVDIAYKERLFEGIFPIAFVFLQVNPALLDVNIHPNKKLIKFDDDEKIIELVSSTLLKGVMSSESLPKLSEIFEHSREHNIVEVETAKDALSYNIDTLNASKNTNSNAQVVKETATPFISESQVDIKELLQTKSRQVLNNGTKPDRNGDSDIDDFIAAPVNIPFKIENLTITGSIFNSYITAVDDENFYLIDQHAAHERVFYEEFVGGYLRDNAPAQKLLIPIVLNLTPEMDASIDIWESKLKDMGFILEEFGPRTYRITEIPDFMELDEAESFAISFIENFDSKLDYNNTVIINKLITRSCKSAVKAHDRLSSEEMAGLLRDLAKCRNPFSCPHGRPIFVKFTPYDLAKMFKRA
ncbi:MAG: DNA mismatch repair endonuclease MutL [Peptostreptococcaceae bacterium]|nr:DNA mismatch repair endonuclease MutL [Peptostreptococcaceae bacterium]MDY5739392.1 DNA mismatch repair endonuclease MutL [Anaerovoracaceae bacterium]